MRAPRALGVVAATLCLTSACRDLCKPNPCTKVPGLSVCAVAQGNFTCSCDTKAWEADGAGACRPLTGAYAGPPDGVVDWTQAEPSYTAEVRLVGAQNEPLRGAVVAGALRYDADERGVVRIARMPAKDAALVRVQAPGHVSATRTLTLTQAGYQPLEVRLQPVLVERDVPSTEGAELVTGPASVRLFARTVVDASGNPYDGQVRVKVAAWDPRASGFRPGVELPAPRTGTSLDGGLVALGDGPVVAVQLETPAGAPLQLDARATAAVTLALPATPPVELGRRLPLFSLDEAAGLWREEGSCVVQDVPAGLRYQDRARACVGEVRHFSLYLVDPWTGQQTTFSAYVNACLRVQHDVTMPLALTLHHVESGVEECSHVEGQPCTSWRAGFLFPNMDSMFPNPDGAGAGMYCAAGLAQQLYRWPSSTLPGAPFVTMEHRLRSTLYAATNAGPVAVAEVTTPIDLRTLAPVSLCQDASCVWGSVQQYSGALGQLCQGQLAGRTCNGVRVKLELLADGTTIGGIAGAVDEDHDGYPKLAGSTPLPAVRYDCDDADPAVHPNGLEVRCNGKDDDCDGTPDATRVSFRDFPDVDVWNRTCAALACKTTEAETFGNRIDEDCNGFASDMDGDGVKAKGDPTSGLQPDDCNDTCATCKPGATEATGNTLDEDCDGFALDPDSDGFASPLHAERTTLPATDCDDTNPLALPSSDAGEGRLARYYVNDGGVIVRTAAFCALFDAAGKPTAQARRQVFADTNCDGFASDLDNDGWTVPGDNRLGADKAFDCNDLDPRVHPEDGGYGPDSVRPSCPDPFRAGATPGAANESSCTPDLARFGGSARFVCPNAPHGGVNACEDVVDQNNVPWGVFACNAKDWGLGDPLRPTAYGQLWGPCDFGVHLPACPDTAQCSGRPGAFSAAYRAKLAQAGYAIDAMAWVGTCLPKCGDRCHPNVCASTTPACTLENRQAVCR